MAVKPAVHGRDHERGAQDALLIKRFLPVVLDGIGATLTTGVKGDVPVHFDADLVGWRIVADQVGSIVVDIWKSAYSAFPPTVANTITAADPPTLSSDDKADDTTLTGWTTSVTAGDVLRFHIDSASSVTRVTLTLVLVT